MNLAAVCALAVCLSVFPYLAGAGTADRNRTCNADQEHCTDGGAVDPCACPEGFKRCAGRCYSPPARDSPGNYSEAAAYCKVRGSILTTPRSWAEDDCAPSPSDAYGLGPIWLGYRRNETAKVGEPLMGADGQVMTFNGTWMYGFQENIAEYDCIVSFYYVYLDVVYKYWLEQPCNVGPPYGTGYFPHCQLENSYLAECDNSTVTV